MQGSPRQVSPYPCPRQGGISDDAGDIMMLRRPGVTVSQFAGLLLCAVFGLPGPAAAQPQFDGSYTLSMAGIAIGKLSWRGQFSPSDYTTTASGRASGLFSLLVSGEGSVNVRGVIQDGRAQPARFVSAVQREDGKTGVQMTFEAGAVRELKVEEPPPESDRVPIADAHKQDVIDPLSALLIPVAGGATMPASACTRVLNIFDGRRRFDLALTFRRIDKATPEKGYRGPALVCGIKFMPVSGHRTSSPLVKFLSEGRDIEIWFVPVAGTNFLAPVKLSVASLLGDLVLRADRFETAAANHARP